jgi:hypothetical protein
VLTWTSLGKLASLAEEGSERWIFVSAQIGVIVAEVIGGSYLIEKLGFPFQFPLSVALTVFAGLSFFPASAIYKKYCPPIFQENRSSAAQFKRLEEEIKSLATLSHSSLEELRGNLEKMLRVAEEDIEISLQPFTADEQLKLKNFLHNELRKKQLVQEQLLIEQYDKMRNQLNISSFDNMYPAARFFCAFLLGISLLCVAGDLGIIGFYIFKAI